MKKEVEPEEIETRVVWEQLELEERLMISNYFIKSLKMTVREGYNLQRTLELLNPSILITDSSATCTFSISNVDIIDVLVSNYVTKHL